MFKFSRTMNIKEQYYFNRGRGVAPENFWKIYACSNFFDPPSLGVWIFFDPPPFWGLKLFWPLPPFWSFKTFLTPLLIFQPPHRGIYERSLIAGSKPHALHWTFMAYSGPLNLDIYLRFRPVALHYFKVLLTRTSEFGDNPNSNNCEIDLKFTTVLRYEEAKIMFDCH